MAYYWIDIVAAAVVMLSAIVGMCRGFFASLLSLLGFVGTFILAYFFSDNILALLDQICGLSGLIEGVLGTTVGHIVAVIIAFIVTFLVIKIVIFILNHTIGKLFTGRALGGVNKFMGFILGIVKGTAYVAITLVAINLASLIPSVKNWSSTTFEQTYVVGKVYNWVGAQLGNYLVNSNTESEEDSNETLENQNQDDVNNQNS